MHGPSAAGPGLARRHAAGVRRISMTRRWMPAAALAALLAGGGIAQADKIKNPIAVFSGLDKITGRIISFEVAIDETVQFGALQMTPRVCYTRPPTESPNTTSFVEVDEIALDGKYRRVFTGWMFADSPGLHAIEHPVYDIWLVDCKGGTEVIAEPKEAIEEPPLRRSAAAARRREGRPAASWRPPARPAAAPPRRRARSSRRAARRSSRTRRPGRGAPDQQRPADRGVGLPGRPGPRRPRPGARRGQTYQSAAGRSAPGASSCSPAAAPRGRRTGRDAR